MAWQPVTNIKGTSLENPRLDGDNLIVDEVTGSGVATPVNIGNVRGVSVENPRMVDGALVVDVRDADGADPVTVGVVRGTGVENPRLSGDNLIVDVVSGSGTVTPTDVGNVRGQDGTDGAQGLPGVNAVENDEAVAEYISTAGTSATQTALEAFVGDRLPAVSVVPFGAVGDGTTDDSAAIQAAITAAGEAPVALIPGATHRITSALDVPVLYGNGATITIDADVDGLIVRPHTRMKDVNVRVTYAGEYTKAAVRLHTDASWNVAATALLQNLTLEGKNQTTLEGSGIEADDGGVRGVVCFLTAEGLRIKRFKYGIRFRTTQSNSWFNGNAIDANMWECANFYWIEGAVNDNAFTGQVQPTPRTQTVVRCSGNGNKFHAKVWDLDSYPDVTPYVFTIDGIPGSYNQVLNGKGAPGEWLFSESNQSNGDWLVPWSGLVLPHPKDRSSFTTKSSSNLNILENLLGEQDNILKMAHLNHTVTTTTGAGVNGAFTFGASPAIISLEAGVPFTITIDCTASPLTALHTLGVLFVSKALMPDKLTIQTENTASMVTDRLVIDELGRTLNYVGAHIGGVVAKVYVTIESATAKSVRIASIFASSGGVAQKSFVQTDGATPMWGDVRFGSTSYGPVIVSPNGTKYRLKVDNAGALTTQVVT